MFAHRPGPLFRAFLATALIAGGNGVAAQSEPVTLASIDLFGTDAIDPDTFRAEFGEEIAHFVALLEEARTDPNADPTAIEARAEALQGAVEARLGSIVPLAQVEFGATTDFGPPPRIHVMVDVVEEADKRRRMPFREAPTKRFDDPGGLFALWSEFQQKVLTLAYAGASLQVARCPVLHCIAPFELPELEPYLEKINAGVSEHEAMLYTIAAQSGDSSHRANALFLLAHTNNAARLLPALRSAIYDPNGSVRNNAMRVLMFLAQSRPDLDHPVSDLIAALDFPSASDRNKAGYALAALAGQARYRDEIRAGATPIALRMLRLMQPNNHDPAYEILQLVSGETYGARDYAAWERWAAATLVDP